VAIGVGDSNQAPFTLIAPIPAGTWHLVGDGEDVALQPVVQFDIIWRHGGASTTVASTTHTFVGPGTVPFATDLTGTAVDPQPGDQLILVFSTIGGGNNASYTPNGDGSTAGGAVPNLTLPR
jgi:hypothetical protein